MLFQRMLFLSGVAGLAACSSPTAPTENLTSLPPTAVTPPVVHSEPSGPFCVGHSLSQLCAPTSGKQ